MRESFPYGGTTIIMDFIYDEAGRPFCVAYSKDGGASYTNYFYAVNAQGDVEGIFRVIKNDETGKYEQKWYGRYVYDAWGNVTATTAAGGKPSATSLVVRNPIRYRGYVYDNETGFYYLQSRYYDPANHRFISADTAEYSAMSAYSLNDTNLFTYCGNNPVNRADDGGEFWNIVIGAAVGAVAGALAELAVETLEYIATGDSIDWVDVATEAVGGAIYGGIVAGTGSTALASAASSVTTTVIYGIRNGDSVGKIALKATGNVVTAFAPKAVNKVLGGKYAKLNNVGKAIKKYTDEPYVGKFSNAADSKLFVSIVTSVKRGINHFANEYYRLISQMHHKAIRGVKHA